ncbi:MAG: cellulose binding domain-containing protein [Sarcina sp.]
MRKMHNKLKRVISLFICLLFVLSLAPTSLVLANPKAASGAPGVATLQHNQYGNDTDGEYTISFSMWYGNNGTSYKLFERIGIKNEFVQVAAGELEDTSPNPQHGEIQISGRKLPGTYYYQLELTNEHGSTVSNIISLRVGSAQMSDIVIDIVDDEKTQSQFTVEQGVTEYDLIHIDVETPKFSVISSNTSVAKASIVNGNKLRIEGIESGRSGFKIVEETSGEERYVGCRVLKEDKTLPGMPDYLSIGQVSEDTDNDLNFWRDIDTDDTNKRMDIRYIYINGGPFSGWRTWTTEDGGRAKKYITESLKLGMIPFFVYYNIPDSSEDYAVDLAHINDKAYMEAYFKDLKFLLDICIEYAGDETVGMVFEPDFLGYMMQQSGKQPNEITAVVDAAYSCGVLEKGKDPEFENNVKGLVEAINYTVEKYYPQAYNGWQFNIWSYNQPGVPGQGLLHKTEFDGWDEGRKFIKDAATATAEYYSAAGINSYGTEFISIDKYGLDGAYEAGAAENPKDSKWLWNADIWNNYLLYTKTLHEVTEQPVILWQLPVGHLNSTQTPDPYDGGNFDDLSNAVAHYEDSAPTFFFGDTFKASGEKRTEYFGTNEANDPKIKAEGDTITWGGHMEEAKDAGVISMLFGAGVGASTDAVGSPPTDDYWWITKAQHYFKNPLQLDGSIKPPTPDVKPPRKPSITASTNETTTGDYTISATIPSNSLADSYELFENGKVIDNGSVTSEQASIKKDFAKKPVGDYEYYIKLVNKDGETSSTTIKVSVVKEPITPPEPPIDPPTPGENGYKVEFEVTQDWNSGANYQMTIRNTGSKPITDWTLTFEFAKKIQSAWDVKLTEKSGVYTVIPNSWNKTIPANGSISFGGACDGGIGNIKPTNIKLTGTGIGEGSGEITPPPTPESPKKASITASTADSKDGKYSVSASIPKDSKATKYEIFENGKSIKTGNVTAVTATVKCDIAKTASGNFEYYVALTNDAGTTKSDKISVKVTIDSEGGGTNPDPTEKAWKAGTSYQKGDVVTYSGKTYICLQPHQSLHGWEPTNVPALWAIK